jgi:alkanesulfonate monooxygenase SsuD/methylene tetrahydromethanopterin reductase-like flavin-dependent oxidoreductase (luciferase family)
MTSARADMEYGAHLPLIDLGTRASLPGLKAYARAAAALGYRYLCANDHLLFSRPWLDGPTALATVIEESNDLRLATTIALPVVRGPVQLAKTLAAIDVLSDGRLVAGAGPGSSARDYEAVGLPFDDRWRRFDEALQALRALLEGRDFEGERYSTRGITLEPPPVQQPGPPIWVASWGSAPGIRRVARFGDGWLASAYNTTPDRVREGLDRLGEALRVEGKQADSFPNAIATTWLYVTEDRNSAERMLTDVLAPMLNRPVDALRSLSLPIGPAEVCAERLAAFASAGAQRLFLWPLRDELRQLELFRERVAPLI